MAEVIQRNARGGIDKLSNREALGARPQGATGTGQSFAIPVTKLQPATPAQIPPPPLPEDPGNLVGANNTAIAPTLAPHGFSLDANGQFAYTPPKETTDSTSGYDKIFSQYLGLQEAPTSTADIYASEANAAGLTDKRNTVSSLTGRLNSIVAKNQADQLRLEQSNSSNDVSKGVFNAQVARLNREAAIAALPVQAQLSAAQGDLAMAEQHVDKMFQIKSQDALAQYQWKNKVLDSVYSFANAQEQRRLDELQRNEAIKYETKKSNINALRDASNFAIQNGQSELVTRLGQLDPSSDTFQQDFSAIQSQMVDRNSLLDRQYKQAQIAKLNSEIVGANPSQNDDIVSYAQQFMDTGKLPSVSELKNSGLSVSQVTEYAKQLPKADGALLSSSTGVKTSTLSPTQEDGILALRDIKIKIQQLKELDKERQKGLISATFGKVFGSDDQQRYMDLRGEIVDLLARARTGAALTSQEEKFYADQLPGRVGQIGVLPTSDAGLFGVNTGSRIENFDTKITSTLDTKLAGQGLVIQGYSKVEVPSLGKHTVGEVLNIGGSNYRVLPDGTLTDVI